MALEKAKRERAELKSPNYLVAHACFDCRLSFKRATPKSGASAVCPNCGGEAFWMGRSFRAPAKSNTEQWQKVRVLYQHGFRFGTYRHGGPSLPAKLSQVAQFLRDNPNHPCKIKPSRGTRIVPILLPLTQALDPINEKAIRRGHRRYRRLNCRGCHLVAH
jgi:hypothetical protein